MNILRTTTPIARRIHYCGWCCMEIKIKTKYENTSIVYDNRLFSFKNHINCGLIAKKLKMFDDTIDGEGLTSEEFREDIKCEFDKITPNQDIQLGFSFKLKTVLKHHKIIEI